jgi:hypothetical protein
MIIRKKLFSRCVLVFLLFLPVSGGAGEFCDEPLSQLHEFASYYPDDEKIQENLPVIENICLNEEKKSRKIDSLLIKANLPGDIEEYIREKYQGLFRHDTFFLQQIFQYQVETGMTFDLNFFQNMMARSGLTAIRLAKDRYGTNKAVYGSLEELLQEMKGAMSKRIPSDQQLVDPEVVKRKRALNAETLQRLERDDLLLLKVERPEEFNDFFEILQVFRTCRPRERRHR